MSDHNLLNGSVCLKGPIGLYLCLGSFSYLSHDVPGTTLIRPSVNVISTKLRVSNGTNAWEYLLSNDSS